MTAKEVIKTCNFVKCENDMYTLKTKHKYYGQVQLGMAMLNLKEADFVIYSSMDNSIIIINVSLDNNFVQHLLKKLKFNFFSHMLHIACVNV